MNIQELPKDCFKEIFSYCPSRNFGAFCSVSKHFSSEAITYLAGREEKVIQTFIQFIQKSEFIHGEFKNRLPRKLQFTATSLFEHKKKVRACEIRIARALSKTSFKKLKEESQKNGSYLDVATIFYLASLFHTEWNRSIDLTSLVEYGYLDTLKELFKLEQLPENALSYLAAKLETSLLDLFNLRKVSEWHYCQIQQALHIDLLRKGKTEEYLTFSMEEKLELAKAKAIKGDFSFYDSIPEPDYSLDLKVLTSLGLIFTKAGDFPALRMVEARAESIPKKKQVEPLSNNKISSRFSFWPKSCDVNEIYELKTFNKMLDDHWELMVEEPFFEFHVFKKLLESNQNKKANEYLKKADQYQKTEALYFSTQQGKLIASQEEMDNLISLHHFEQGITSNTDLLEVKLKQENPQNYRMWSKLAVLYASKGKFEKALKLMKKVKDDQESDAAIHQIAIHIAEKGDFDHALEVANRFLENADIDTLARCKIASIAAKHGIFEYLARELHSGFWDDALFEFSLDIHPSFIFDLNLPPSQLHEISQCLLQFLIKKGEIEKGIDLFYFSRDHIKAQILFEFGMACADRGYIAPALKAAELLDLKDNSYHYKILLNLKRYKVENVLNDF